MGVFAINAASVVFAEGVDAVVLGVAAVGFALGCDETASGELDDDVPDGAGASADEASDLGGVGLTDAGVGAGVAGGLGEGDEDEELGVGEVLGGVAEDVKHEPAAHRWPRAIRETIPAVANPAQALYDLLSVWEWTPANIQMLAERTTSAKGEDDGDWWGVHSRAVRLFDEVRAEVDRRTSAGRSLRISKSGALDRIARGIFATDTTMGVFSTVRQMFQEEDLVALELLAESWPTAPALHPTIAEGLLAFATDARDLVMDEASTLDDDSTAYLLKLIDALENAIRSAQSNEGTADVRRLSTELVGALGALLLEGEGEQQDKARKLIERSLTWVKAVVIDKGTGAFFAAIGSAGGVAVTHYLGLPPGP